MIRIAANASRIVVRAVTSALACALVLSAPSTRAGDTPPTTRLLSIGPWSAVSGLIGYRERLWFVNGEKFVNHNAADLHSYDPRTGTSRYERHLFSQDAGDPTIVDGLLVWPFEDARFSAGRGEFAITDGLRWRWGWLPAQQVFHVHAATATPRTLYVATSAWRAGIQRSRDLGGTWEVLYEHPTEPGRVSRFTTLAILDGTLYAGLTSRTEAGAKLYHLSPQGMRPADDWPAGSATRYLTTHRGWLYAVNHGPDGIASVRTDAERVERLAALDAMDVRGFASGEQLWAIVAEPDAAAVLSSEDGVHWSRAATLPGAEPVSVTVYAGGVYVGAVGPHGQGSLWGPAPPWQVEPPGPAATLPPIPRAASADQDLAAALRTLDAVLGDTANLDRYHGRLEAALTPLVAMRAPAVGRALSERLDRDYPQAEISRFGGRVRIPLARSNRWHLLRAIALTGHGRVPPAMLSQPWSSAPNRAEKYLDALPAAAWAMEWVGQDDPETIAALVDRLGDADLPPWVTGDLVGALSALTGQRFGYDLDAWRAWSTARQAAGR